MSRRYVAVTVETPHLIKVSGPIDHKIAGKQKKISLRQEQTNRLLHSSLEYFLVAKHCFRFSGVKNRLRLDIAADGCNIFLRRKSLQIKK